MTQQVRLAAVTGATGHVGARLVPALLAAGWRVRVLSRNPSALEPTWRDRVEVVRGDATDPDCLARLLEGAEVAYYLLHSMDGKGDFRSRDRELALGFAQAASRAGLGRTIYLSGLHPDGELSPHLASRVEVGRALASTGVPTVVLQAGTLLGAGSASYEMMRHLTERLPVMVGPRWLRSRIQPIATDDAVHYLVAVADLPAGADRTFDIAGPEVLTYAEMMRRYARVAGLRRRRVGIVPVLTPKLAAHWVGLMTPVRAGVAGPLAGSLVHDAVAGENDIVRWVAPPPGGPAGFDEAVKRALPDADPTRWSRALAFAAGTVGTAAVAGSLLTDPKSQWYRALDLPSWQPPALAFPLVWTGLYATTTLASAATIAELPEAQSNSYRRALVVNMLLNTSWSGVFFRAHRPAAATVVAAALATSSADLARRADGAQRGLRTVSLGGYAAWCGFATVLSGEIARRNRR